MSAPTQHTQDQATALAIELTNINKAFGPVQANRDVNLAVRKGTIHGIVGENGAGKSTLMSILYGFYEADSGKIQLGGKPLKIQNSRQAIESGIGMVHQHFMLVDRFTVLENIMLGAESGARLNESRDRARQELQRLADEFGLNVDPDIVTSELSVGLQQRVEILKALYRGAEILILDEPTGVLTPQEADQLFKILATLRNRGVSVILITHKLQEIMAITDYVSVMRQGTMVAERRTSDTSKEELAELMVGRKVLLKTEKDERQAGDALMQARNINYFDDKGVQRLKDINLDLRSGEIVGIAGVSGNGQTELMEILSGMVPLQEGALTLPDGTKVDSSTVPDAKDFRNKSIGHVPEDRLKSGMVKAFKAQEAAIMGFHDDKAYNGTILMDNKKVEAHCLELMEAYDVRPADPSLKSANFSGGNQQKLVLAREMERRPSVLLVGQPTRGVDIGAIEFIHKNLIRMRDEGHAILLVSVELEEIMSLSDRILVMFDGQIVGEIEGRNATTQKLGLMMGNAKVSETPEEQAKDLQEA
ncbi:ABC transporter ATP-binding protein [Kiloniella sp. b19]|uniref:ABC transporter ATP-binding protein n=1 Tax=Kiloniella sp. GXU_MW_B19 TaxID=3141326 RepID=UPI0031CF3F14